MLSVAPTSIAGFPFGILLLSLVNSIDVMVEGVIPRLSFHAFNKYASTSVQVAVYVLLPVEPFVIVTVFVAPLKSVPVHPAKV